MTTHYIEEGLCAYVKLSDDRKSWVIDGMMVDGCGLDSYYDDPVRGNCECDDQEDCIEAWNAARELPFPNAEELMLMIADALGYNVIKVDGPVCTNCNRTESQDDSCADATNGKHQFS